MGDGWVGGGKGGRGGEGGVRGMGIEKDGNVRVKDVRMEN